ncbi:hypothetical protein RRSWK_04140 [Rhodopirellula sp. SWK7]|nr:hypothetical protein RRSWK_04140 [Rhodopirellula sp. SWK7]
MTLVFKGRDVRQNVVHRSATLGNVGQCRVAMLQQKGKWSRHSWSRETPRGVFAPDAYRP